MMDQGTEVKAGKVTKLCWLVCVIVIVVAVVISLLAVILYEVQNQQGPSSNDCCEKSVEYQLAEDQATFLLQIRDLCTAICNAYFAPQGDDLETSRLTSETSVVVDPRAEVVRCLSCCQLLEEADCTNLNVQGYDNYCAWVDSGNSSACDGTSLSPQPIVAMCKSKVSSETHDPYSVRAKLFKIAQ